VSRTYRPLTTHERGLAADPAVHAIAAHLLRAAGRRYPKADQDAMRSEVGLAICQAARTYDPTKGTTWKTHASNRMKGAILDVVRKDFAPRHRCPRPPVVSIEEPVDSGDHRRGVIRDSITAAELPVGWEVEREDECHAVADRAGGGGRVVRLCLIRADCAYFRHASLALGITESGVSRLAAEAVKRLREHHDAGRVDLWRLAGSGGAA
jgi:hypothetical protein